MIEIGLLAHPVTLPQNYCNHCAEYFILRGTCWSACPHHWQRLWNFWQSDARWFILVLDYFGLRPRYDYADLHCFPNDLDLFKTVEMKCSIWLFQLIANETVRILINSHNWSLGHMYSRQIFKMFWETNNTKRSSFGTWFGTGQELCKTFSIIRMSRKMSFTFLIDLITISTVFQAKVRVVYKMWFGFWYVCSSGTNYCGLSVPSFPLIQLGTLMDDVLTYWYLTCVTLIAQCIMIAIFDCFVPVKTLDIEYILGPVVLEWISNDWPLIMDIFATNLASAPPWCKKSDHLQRHSVLKHFELKLSKVKVERRGGCIKDWHAHFFASIQISLPFNRNKIVTNMVTMPVNQKAEKICKSTFLRILLRKKTYHYLTSTPRLKHYINNVV